MKLHIFITTFLVLADLAAIDDKWNIADGEDYCYGVPKSHKKDDGEHIIATPFISLEWSVLTIVPVPTLADYRRVDTPLEPVQG